MHMGLEIKGKAALANKTLGPCSPQAQGGRLVHSQPVALAQPMHAVSTPSLGELRPLLCSIPAIYMTHGHVLPLVDPASISTPPPTVTVPTAASRTVILTSGGQARPIPTV